MNFFKKLFDLAKSEITGQTTEPSSAAPTSSISSSEQHRINNEERLDNFEKIKKNMKELKEYLEDNDKSLYNIMGKIYEIGYNIDAQIKYNNNANIKTKNSRKQIIASTVYYPPERHDLLDKLVNAFTQDQNQENLNMQFYKHPLLVNLARSCDAAHNIDAVGKILNFAAKSQCKDHFPRLLDTQEFVSMMTHTYRDAKTRFDKTQNAAHPRKSSKNITPKTLEESLLDSLNTYTAQHTNKNLIEDDGYRLEIVRRLVYSTSEDNQAKIERFFEKPILKESTPEFQQKQAALMNEIQETKIETGTETTTDPAASTQVKPRPNQINP